MDLKDWGVHVTHCCAVHGCKYGEDDCPVALGKVAQKYACMDDNVNDPCFNDFKKHTGFNTHAELAAYELGREHEGKVIEKFLNNWKGETNSQFGTLLKEKFTSLYPRVGVGIMIFKDGKVLMGKRKGKHGAGEYAWPGGHLEYMETIEDCAKREVREETGLEICNIRLLRVMNLVDYPPTHFVDIGLVANWLSGEPTLVEPDACEGWEWYSLDELPSPLFAPIPSYVEAFKNNFKIY
jgi:8-oxo-dGTP diphosphatase